MFIATGSPVKLCTAFGAGYFYIPGTDTCQNARQITANQFDIARLPTGSGEL